jgi:hypothetical protein
MLFGETVAVYCENHTEHTDTLCAQNAGFLLHIEPLGFKGSIRIILWRIYLILTDFFFLAFFSVIPE